MRSLLLVHFMGDAVKPVPISHIHSTCEVYSNSLSEQVSSIPAQSPNPEDQSIPLGLEPIFPAC
jgi:hypothetical protein